MLYNEVMEWYDKKKQEDDDMKTIKDISYAPYADTVLDLYLPECEEFSVFVYFHGGGLEVGDKEDAQVFAKKFTDQNIALVSANYRMYPTAVYPEFIRDAAAAVSWVKNHIEDYGNCEKIYVGGSSAGGYLSMMLCFDKKYLAPYKIEPADLAGFIHDAGQPTVHFKILRERGIDTRRVIIDESAPIWHVGTAETYPPMLFIVSDEDMENRYEQTVLMLSTLKHFGYDQSKIKDQLMHGTQCHYTYEGEEDKFVNVVSEFIKEF